MSKHHDPIMTGTKVCSTCSKDLPEICFAVKKANNDGLAFECRECMRERTKRLRPKKGISKKKLLALTGFHEFHKDVD